MREGDKERELVAEVELVDGRGRLRPEAIGWSRRPLHRCNLTGHRLRKKRWDHWCVTSKHHVLTITVADIDYLGLVVVDFLELSREKPIERVAVRPFGLGVPFPEVPQGADLVVDLQGVHVAIREEAAGTHLEAAFEPILGFSPRLRADVMVERPAGHESLNVVVPWSRDRFQFTSKQAALPARGEVVVDGTSHEFSNENGAFACLDYGRGVWPYRTRWNWGSAAGVRAGRTIGLNLGGIWTDGTGATENGVWVDGRLHKLGEPVDFVHDPADPMKPWNVRSRGSPRVDLRFSPARLRDVGADLALLAGALRFRLGTWDGTIAGDDGAPIAIDGLFGWAEEVRLRW